MGHQDPAGTDLFAPQVEHYHLDWHRFNLKQRLLGRQTLPAEEFEERTRTGEGQGCPQQSPEAIRGPAEAVPSRDNAPSYLCQLKVPLSCPQEGLQHCS